MTIIPKKLFFITLLLTTMLESCMFGAGSHGGIINYCYKVNHGVLDSMVQLSLKSNQVVKRDSASHGGYNDGDYFVLLVDKPSGTYQYNFRYYGDSSAWREDSIHSCMFIWAMYNPKNEGGWEKDFGISNRALKKELLQIIETEFILKLDKQLGTDHSVEN